MAEPETAEESRAAGRPKSDVDTDPDAAFAAFAAPRIRSDPVVKSLVLGRLFGPKVARPNIGRFTIIGTIGAGAMGIVYEAVDPQLARPVALKVLKSDADDPVARARLLREARAVALVSHPNVITVYEAGDLDGQVYLAMERVHGVALDAWLAPTDGRRRHWREILDVFIAAGRGLAAAHAAGIVHRDFKPGNVIVSDDGQVKVLDFGLARPTDAVPASELAETGHDLGEHAWSATLALTCTGAILGTPAYMSPEQHRGEPVTGLSDQFSFCVALWEAIYGQHPFPCHSYAVLREAVLAGRVREAPRIRGVPGWLRRAVSTGLARDPDGRFPSMAELLRLLERRRANVLSRVAAIAGVASTLVGLGYSGYAVTRPGTIEVAVRGRGGPVAAASVRIDGAPLAGPGGAARGEVRAGVHALEIEAPGYRLASRAVEVARGETRHIEVALQREQGSFDLEVEPAGSVVTIDGVDHGSRLRNVAVDTGTRELLVRHRGYHDRRLRWEARADEARSGFVSLAPAASWSRQYDDFNAEIHALGDIDGDGLEDILLDRLKELVAVDPHGDRDLWRLAPAEHFDFAPWVEDLDGDGVRDVIAAYRAGGEAVTEAWSGAARGGPVAAPRRLWRIAGPASAVVRETRVGATAVAIDDVPALVAPWLDPCRLDAIDPRSGQVLWRSEAVDDALVVTKLVTDDEGRPVIAAATHAELFVIDVRDGTRRWIGGAGGRGMRMARPWGAPASHEAHPVDTVGDIFAVTAAQFGRTAIERVRASDGSRHWRQEAGPCHTLVPGPDGGSLLVCLSPTALSVRDAERGELRWERGGKTRLLGLLPHGRPLAMISHARGAALVGLDDGHEEAVFALEAPARSGTQFDWDGDGRDELVFATEAGTLEAIDARGASRGTAAVPLSVHRFRPLGDLGGDGLPDLGLISDGGFAVVQGTRIRWERRAQKGIRATPTIADYDGDGRREVAVAGHFEQREAVVVLDLESGRELGRAPDIGHDIIRAPAVVPGPRGFELLLLIRRDQGVVRYDPIRGEVVASVPGFHGYATPAIADLDDDGADEAVVMGWWPGSPLSVFDAETLALRWSLAVPDGAWAEPLVARPPSAAASPRIVLALNDGTVMVVDAEARATSWHRQIGPRHFVAPAVADVDDDGALDLLVAEVTDERADLVRLDLESGAALWSRPDVGGRKARPLVGDVDGDGALEVVSLSERAGAFAVSAEGAVRWRYRPRPLAALQPAASTDPVLVDLEGDGHLELLAAFEGAGLHVLDAATGALRWRFAPHGNATIEATPVTVDVEGDGMLEIVVADRGGVLSLIDGARAGERH